MCQNWLLMVKNEIKVSLYLLQRLKLRASARNWVVPRINTFVPVIVMTGTISMYLCEINPRDKIKLRYIEALELRRIDNEY